MSAGGRRPAGMKPAGTAVTGTVRGDLLMTAGAAIVAFHVLTLPFGEGAVNLGIDTERRVVKSIMKIDATKAIVARRPEFL